MVTGRDDALTDRSDVPPFESTSRLLGDST